MSQVVIDFMRRAVQREARPDVYLRTLPLQTEINLALRRSHQLSEELSAARFVRDADAVKRLTTELLRSSEQIAAMCTCVRTQFDREEP